MFDIFVLENQTETLRKNIMFCSVTFFYFNLNIKMSSDVNINILLHIF